MAADGAAGRAILPRTAANLDIRVMRGRRIAKARRLQVMVVRVKLRTAQADLVVHVQQHLTVRRNHHAAAADRRISPQADGCAHHMRVAVVRTELVHRFQRVVRIAALIGAGHNHVRVVPCNVRIRLVEICIVAHQEAVFYAFQLNDCRFGVLPAIILVQLVYIHLRFHAMLLEIAARLLTLAVENNRRVAQPRLRRINAIDKQQRMAALCRRSRFFQQIAAEFLIGGQHFLLRPRAARHVGVFRHHNHIHAVVALAEQLHLRGIVFVNFGIIKAICRLNHACFHHYAPSGSIIFFIIPPYTPFTQYKAY